MPGPYLIHPDKLDAIHNIVLKNKARKSASGAAPSQLAAQPASGNIVLKLMQNAYVEKRTKLGRSY